MATDEYIRRAVPAGHRPRSTARAQSADLDWILLAARRDAMRQSLVDAAHRLAATEDEAACLYAGIAAHRRDSTDNARRLAEHARASARRAREIANYFSRSD
ncbi:hypothetical protein [Nocardia terpenica]|uniref:Uncharacterized protein n=1 Tax=Nocardia terpenica TaxID=455432 RepID=A0A164KRN2_9NOCA|nr:hypothetical protein [Nocardia terpenica]KZM71659.1 hypothetical protein AWN90_02745 [Nocardia terpenica]NQE90886.1 hypothetical protein [Nocardia terpenica]